MSSARTSMWFAGRVLEQSFTWLLEKEHSHGYGLKIAANSEKWHGDGMVCASMYISKFTTGTGAIGIQWHYSMTTEQKVLAFE